MSMLEVQNLCVQYRSQKNDSVLKGVTFSVEEGESVGIVGESGSGKSTAMLAVMGLLGNRAEICGGCILFQKRTPVPGRDVAMIFQDSLSCLNPTVKVGRQITETVRARRKCGRKEARERALELLDLVGIKNGKLRMKQYPFELSGGMRQRVAAAVALACEPKLIIADEPTTALDPVVQAQILMLLRRIVRDTGTALLLVSHDLGVTAALCERIYVMRSGEIVESGPVEDLFYAPEHDCTKKLLQDAKGKKKYLAAADVDGTLLRLDKVTKAFDTRDGVYDISLEIHRGETYALAGESGSGKTTLARILTGILPYDSGEILYRGKKLETKERMPGRAGKIQMVFQDPYGSLNPRLTVGETLEEALRAAGEKNRAVRRKKAEEMLGLTGLDAEDMERFPSEFSGGQRQRIGIARALILEPEMLVCDEALSALDASTRTQILELLTGIQRARGIACLFISHDMHVIRRVSRRMGVLYRGRMMETGETEEVCSDPWHPYTKQLLDAVPEPDPFRARKIKAPSRDSREQKDEAREGCPFSGQCPYVMECCRNETPECYTFGTRRVSCFLYSEKHSGKRKDGYRMTSQI